MAYDIAWVRDDTGPVDTVNGFVEVYLDPRGAKGAWEGIVSYVNRDKTRRIETIAAHAAVVRGSHAVGGRAIQAGGDRACRRAPSTS